MPDHGDAPAALTQRMAALERSLRRTRWALTACGILALVLATAGWMRSQTLEAQRLVLTDASGEAVIVLEGQQEGRMPALVLQTPTGAEVLTLGPRVHRSR